jgi:hypothetical protein
LGVLQGRYASGYITHDRNFPELETALQDWPNGKMDYPDAVAMAITLLGDFAGMSVMEDEPLTVPWTRKQPDDWRHAP